MQWLTYRRELVVYGLRLAHSGLVRGSGGNISRLCRPGGPLLITPSGMAYDLLKPGDMTLLNLSGRVLEGSLPPSSEWALHAALYRARPDIGAVVHSHSPYATTLACLHWEIPAVHYLVAYAGRRVPLVAYRDFGSQELADAVAAGMASCDAALLANHGLVAAAATLPRAFEAAEQIEFAAQLYYLARVAGEPVLLSEEQMARAVAKIRRYGQAAPHVPPLAAADKEPPA